MITTLQINNFKCFRHSPDFSFSKINLLTGINGRGKSTILQSILVLSQSVNQLGELRKLTLNGRHVQLGNYEDIKNSDTPRGEDISYKVTLDDPKLDVVISFGENERNALTALVKQFSVSAIGDEEVKQFQEKIDSFINSLGPDLGRSLMISKMMFSSVMSSIHYIGADRLGPVRYVDKITLSNYRGVGPKGERTVNVLASEDLPLVYDPLYKGKDAKTVVQQTEEWLHYILDGAKLSVRGKEKESGVLYMLLNNRNNSYNYTPSNVGFGYSYVLPLIVSGLIARQGDILIVENPEAHLHPRAQSKITEFFAIVASCGVQVFIESHSEHILNGLRISALSNDIGISHEDLTIQYFNKDFDSARLVMNSKGKIENWPSGFFDQQELDLANIFKLGR